MVIEDIQHWSAQILKALSPWEKLWAISTIPLVFCLLRADPHALIMVWPLSWPRGGMNTLSIFLDIWIFFGSIALIARVCNTVLGWWVGRKLPSEILKKRSTVEPAENQEGQGES